MRWIFLVPKDWDDEIVNAIFKAVVTPVGVTLHSSLVDFIRRSDIDGGWEGWPRRAAGRYVGAVTPTLVLGRANATIAELLLAKKCPVLLWRDEHLTAITRIVRAGQWRALASTTE